MSDSHQDIIKPQAAPLSHLSDLSKRPSRGLDWRSASVAVAVLVAGMVAFTLIPDSPNDGSQSFENKTEAASTSASASGSTETGSAATSNGPAPFAQTQRARAREQAQKALANFVEHQIQLEESMQVDSWGETQMRDAMSLAQQGDETFVAEKYDQALDLYGQASKALEKLIQIGNAKFELAIENAEAALAQLDPAGAGLALREARVIKPEHVSVQALDARLKNLPHIVTQLRTAKNHEFGGRFDQAIQIYDDVTQLDPQISGIAERRTAAVAGQRGDNLTTHLSNGFNALQERRFEAARSAFNNALRLDPSSEIAAGGLQQVAEQHDLLLIGQHRNSAEQALQQEQWQQAIAAYDKALNLDANLQFAVSGKSDAVAHQRATNLLTKITDAPQRLSSESLFLQANNILADARELNFPGPRLSGLITQVEQLVSIYRDPVELTLLSDAQTDIVMSNVGQLGTFERRTVSVRPGQYTIRGSQDGCRDIFLTVDVLPGMDALDVSCSERL